VAFNLKLIYSHALKLKVAMGALEVQQRYVLHYGARDFDNFVSCLGVFYGHFRVSFLTWWRNQQIRVFQARRLLLALVLQLHEFAIAFVKTLDSKSTVGRQFAGGYPILLLSTSNVEASHVRSNSKPS